MFDRTIETIIEYCALHQQFVHIGPKLIGRAAEIYERAGRLTKRADTGLVSMCHGDIWSNNILFQNTIASDGDRRIDAKLIDFQQVFNGSSCFDIIRLLHGNSHEDLNENDWGELLQYYHSVLEKTLLQLGLPEQRVPTLSQLQAQMLELSVCEAIPNMIVILARNLAPEEEDPIIHFLQNEPIDRRFRLDVLQKPAGEKVLHTVLKYYDKIGVFD